MPELESEIKELLISALRQGPSARGPAVLQKRIAVDRRTIALRHSWWTDIFPASIFWKVARARCVHLVKPTELPRTIVEAFRAESMERMAALLRFLSPLGGSRRFELQAF